MLLSFWRIFPHERLMGKGNFFRAQLKQQTFILWLISKFQGAGTHLGHLYRHSLTIQIKTQHFADFATLDGILNSDHDFAGTFFFEINLQAQLLFLDFLKLFKTQTSR